MGDVVKSDRMMIAKQVDEISVVYHQKVKHKTKYFLIEYKKKKHSDKKLLLYWY